jgi:hypothetical protein
LALAGPARAQASVDDAAVTAALGKAHDAAEHEDCAGVLQALDPLVPGLSKGPQRILVQRMRLVCLGVEGRAGELPAVQQELAQAMPRDGMVKAFGVLIAADQNRFVDAANQLAALADTSPGSLNVLTGAAVRAITMKLVEDHDHEAHARMVIALARADWEPEDLPDLRIGFAEDAIGALIDQGDASEAEGLLDRIDQPELLAEMMTDRHYTKLWPALGERLGPAGTTSVDQFAVDRFAALSAAPDSETAVRDAANAMLLLGRYPDVLDLTDTIPVVDGMSSDAVRALLFRARALAAMRRNGEVDRLFARFMALDPRKSPTVTTALVSYAEFLDEIGQPVRALAVAREARAKAGDLLTDLGKLWLDRTEICTLSTLGRTVEANAAITAIKAHSDQNQAAAIEALLCAKRAAEASRIALKAFADEDAAGDLLEQFQPTASLWGAAPSRLRDLWTGFLARPEIKAAFERRGRILPRNYWPDPKPRAIPHHTASGENLT